MCDVDGIIAALRVISRDAKARIYEEKWDPMVVNRWILLLPGSDTECWKPLLLKGHYNGWASRNDVIAHAHATIAYLDANKKILSLRFRANVGLKESKTIEAEFSELTEPPEGWENAQSASVPAKLQGNTQPLQGKLSKRREGAVIDLYRNGQN
jgi:hypothetical protein